MSRQPTYSLRDIESVIEVAAEIGKVRGELTEARRQVDELTKRLASCTCSAPRTGPVPMPTLPAPIVSGPA